MFLADDLSLHSFRQPSSLVISFISFCLTFCQSICTSSRNCMRYCLQTLLRAPSTATTKRHLFLALDDRLRLKQPQSLFFGHRDFRPFWRILLFDTSWLPQTALEDLLVSSTLLLLAPDVGLPRSQHKLTHNQTANPSDANHFRHG